MLIVRRRVVAGPVFELYVGTVELDGQPAIAAVAHSIGRAETEDVVGRRVLLYFLEGWREVVGIEEGLAARVGRKRGHYFLGVEVGIQIILQGRAVVAGGAAQTTGGRVA